MPNILERWSKARTLAQKALGSDGEVPEISAAIDKATVANAKAKEVFFRASDALGDALLSVDNTNSALINSFEQFRAKIEKNDFGLDAKKSAKEIALARKVLLAAIDELSNSAKDTDKVLNELSRHLSQLGKYKQ